LNGWDGRKAERPVLRAVELRHHLQLFVGVYNYGRRFKTLRGLTPYEFICQTWTKQPERFRLDPPHQMPRPYIYRT
jgi:hypothetical protein